jgi:hypothetical protein
MACHIVGLQLANKLQQPGGEPVGIAPVAIGNRRSRLAFCIFMVKYSQ